MSPYIPVLKYAPEYYFVLINSEINFYPFFQEIYVEFVDVKEPQIDPFSILVFAQEA